MPYTRDDARRYAKANIARICAEQGISIAIKDPELIAQLVSGLRLGKQRADAARVKAGAASTNRVHKNSPDLSR